jgi:N-acetylmuramoyl-L-alanine amidase
MPKHVVRQGECLSSIAAHYGLTSWKAIYDYPPNAAMKQARPNPNLIYPGDTFEIPAIAPKTAPAKTGKADFKVKVPKVKLMLRLRDVHGAPIKAAKYKLQVEATAVEGVTDGQGALAQPLQPRAKLAMLEVELPPPPAAAPPPADGLDLPKETFAVADEPVDTFAEPPPETAVQWRLALGALDPVAQDAGVRERLHNLGYLADASASGAPLNAAVLAFKHDQGVAPVNAAVDDKLRQALARAHDESGP